MIRLRALAVAFVAVVTVLPPGPEARGADRDPRAQREAPASEASRSDARLRDARQGDNGSLGANGGIVYVSNGQVYLVSTDGSNPTRIHQASTSVRHPAISRDGVHLAYASFSGYIHRKRLDSGEVLQASIGEGSSWPAWSPDGRRLALARRRLWQYGLSGRTNSEIVVVDVANAPSFGRNVTEHERDDREPAWSPDGRRIAFSSDRDGGFSVWVMDADGGSPRRVTRSSADDGAPAWSPNGQKIVFARSASPGQSMLWVTFADGEGAHALTEGSHPAWSPDGRWIVYQRLVENRPAIHVIAADGSGRARRLAEGTDPDWRRAVFGSPGPPGVPRNPQRGQPPSRDRGIE